MPTPEQVRVAVESYVELFGAGNRDRWVQLFSEDAVVVDPVPSDPHEGREAIGGFWDGITSMADHVEIDQQALHICGDHAALVYSVKLANADEGGMAFDGVEIFSVDDEGLITSAKAYWDPAELHRIDAPGEGS